MIERVKIIGPIRVTLPDENQGYFSIFTDCAELFGTELQSEAVQLLKAKLKLVRPKPSINHESDFVSISTANIETIISAVLAIFELSTLENRAKFPDLVVNGLRAEFAFAKKNRPKPKKWEVGDVFSIPLKDNSYTIGQVLGAPCTCALYLYRSVDFPNITVEEFEKLTPVSILHLSTGDLLNNGTWQVLFNAKVKLDPNSGHGGSQFEVGGVSYGGCGMMKDLADAYWGLAPWNTSFSEDYYETMLLKNVPRTHVKILGAHERRQYRLDNYGVE